TLRDHRRPGRGRRADRPRRSPPGRLDPLLRRADRRGRRPAAGRPARPRPARAPGRRWGTARRQGGRYPRYPAGRSRAGRVQRGTASGRHRVAGRPGPARSGHDFGEPLMDLRIPRIALIGANGYGLHHRRNLEPKRRAGEVALVGLCDTAEIVEDAEAPVGDTPVFDDYRELLERTDPHVVVIATPPPTHLPIASAAMRHGSDVYLEKPAVADLEEYRRLYEVMTETGR